MELLVHNLYMGLSSSGISFPEKNARTFIFCLLPALGSVWGPVTTASEINAHLSASSCHYHLMCSQVSRFHLRSLARCPVISIERVFYLQACTTLCSKMSKNGSKVAVPYNTGCHKSCIPLLWMQLSFPSVSWQPGCLSVKSLQWSSPRRKG